MHKSIITIIAAALLTACVNEDDAKRTLRDAGYKNIKIKGYGGPFSCGEGDMSTTRFVATNPVGRKGVEGVVCCGLLEGCTIRH